MKNNLHRLSAWFRERERTIWLEYGALSLVVMTPLLLPGYILTLDLVFTPHFPWPQALTNTAPLEATLWLFTRILPGDVIEKIILFAILILSGVGMHKLIRSLAPDARRLAAYAAGILYAINPFTYDRFMAGHWLFLLGYALTPLAVRSFVALAIRPSVRQGMRAGGWTALIVALSIHHLLIIALIGLVAVVAGIAYHRRTLPSLRTLAFSALACFGMFLFLSNYWLIPALFGGSPLAAAVTNFDATHFAAFATDGGSLIGRVANVIRLQGFWAEAQQLYTLPQHVIAGWGGLFLIVWVVIGVGMASLWRRSRMLACLIGVITITGIILASSQLILWLSSLAPPLAGYREPQKFAALAALGYAVLFGFGAARLASRIRHPSMTPTVATILVTLPLLITPPMLWGFAGQLSPRHYPVAWHEANQYLIAATKPGEKTLFLPWHQYASYSFSERTIASPAAKFFEVPTVISDNPEFAGISPTIPSSQTARITALLAERSPHIIHELRQFGIRYILLAHEQDWRDYGWLAEHPLRPVLQTDQLTLYYLEEPHER